MLSATWPSKIMPSSEVLALRFRGSGHCCEAPFVTLLRPRGDGECRSSALLEQEENANLVSFSIKHENGHSFPPHLT